MQCISECLNSRITDTKMDLTTITSIDDLANIQKYVWKTEHSETCYFVSGFWISDILGDIQLLKYAYDSSLLNEFEADDDEFLIVGYLIPAPEKQLDWSVEPVHMKTFIKQFTINCGKSLDDIDRGMWVKNDHESWLKLHTQAHEVDSLFVQELLDTISAKSFYQVKSSDEHGYKFPKVLKNVTISNLSFVDTSIIHMEDGEVYCLTGTLVIPNDVSDDSNDNSDSTSIQVKMFIKDYFYHFGLSAVESKPKGKRDPHSPTGFWVQDVYGQWFKIESYNAAYEQTASISVRLLTAKRLVKYDFNDGSDRGDRSWWGHFTNYKIWKRPHSHMVSLLEIKSPEDKGECSGSLVPVAVSKATPYLKVRVFMRNYNVDNGREQFDDRNRGLWFLCLNNEYFTRVPPCHPDYASCDAQDARGLRQIELVFDAMIYLDMGDVKSFKNYRACNKAITDVYVDVRPNERFDLRYIAAHKEMFIDHWGAQFNESKSRGFFDSIQNLNEQIILATEARAEQYDMTRQLDSDEEEEEEVVGGDNQPNEQDGSDDEIPPLLPVAKKKTDGTTGATNKTTATSAKKQETNVRQKSSESAAAKKSVKPSSSSSSAAVSAEKSKSSVQQSRPIGKKPAVEVIQPSSAKFQVVNAPAVNGSTKSSSATTAATTSSQLPPSSSAGFGFLSKANLERAVSTTSSASSLDLEALLQIKSTKPPTNPTYANHIASQNKAPEPAAPISKPIGKRPLPAVSESSAVLRRESDAVKELLGSEWGNRPKTDGHSSAARPYSSQLLASDAVASSSGGGVHGGFDKKRSRDEAEDGPWATGRQSSSSDYKLCRDCNDLYKSVACNDKTHVDKYRSGEVCTYCRSYEKKNKCVNAAHFNGRPLVPASARYYGPAGSSAAADDRVSPRFADATDMNNKRVRAESPPRRFDSSQDRRQPESSRDREVRDYQRPRESEVRGRDDRPREQSGFGGVIGSEGASRAQQPAPMMGCTQCDRGRVKKRHCTNRLHVDGFLPGEVCSFCLSKAKRPNCNNTAHRDGHCIEAIGDKVPDSNFDSFFDAPPPRTAMSATVPPVSTERPPAKRYNVFCKVCKGFKKLGFCQIAAHMDNLAVTKYDLHSNDVEVLAGDYATSQKLQLENREMERLRREREKRIEDERRFGRDDREPERSPRGGVPRVEVEPDRRREPPADPRNRLDARDRSRDRAPGSGLNSAEEQRPAAVGRGKVSNLPAWMTDNTLISSVPPPVVEGFGAESSRGDTARVSAVLAPEVDRPPTAGAIDLDPTRFASIKRKMQEAKEKKAALAAAATTFVEDGKSTPSLLSSASTQPAQSVVPGGAKSFVIDLTPSPATVSIDLTTDEPPLLTPVPRMQWFNTANADASSGSTTDTSGSSSSSASKFLSSANKLPGTASQHPLSIDTSIAETGVAQKPSTVSDSLDRRRAIQRMLAEQDNDDDEDDGHAAKRPKTGNTASATGAAGTSSGITASSLLLKDAEQEARRYKAAQARKDRGEKSFRDLAAVGSANNGNATISQQHIRSIEPEQRGDAPPLQVFALGREEHDPLRKQKQMTMHHKGVFTAERTRAPTPPFSNQPSSSSGSIATIGRPVVPATSSGNPVGSHFSSNSAAFTALPSAHRAQPVTNAPGRLVKSVKWPDVELRDGKLFEMRRYRDDENDL